MPRYKSGVLLLRRKSRTDIEGHLAFSVIDRQGRNVKWSHNSKTIVISEGERIYISSLSQGLVVRSQR